MISVSIIKLNEVKPARKFFLLISIFSPVSSPLWILLRPPSSILHSSLALQIRDTKLITVMQFLAAVLFAGSQIVFFLASEPLCNVSYHFLVVLPPEGAEGRADE